MEKYRDSFRVVAACLMLLMLTLFVGFAHGANTVVTDINLRTTTITAMDSDFDWQDVFLQSTKRKDYDAGPHVLHVLFIPGATNDKLALFELNASGSDYAGFPAADAVTPYRIPFYGKRAKLFIDFSESVLSGSYKIVIKWGRWPVAVR